MVCPLVLGRPKINLILVFADSFRFKPVNFLKGRNRSCKTEQFNSRERKFVYFRVC